MNNELLYKYQQKVSELNDSNLDLTLKLTEIELENIILKEHSKELKSIVEWNSTMPEFPEFRINKFEESNKSEKSDITRLKNLLRQYRSSIITTYHFKSNTDIVRVIDIIDNSIEEITYGLGNYGFMKKEVKK